MGKFTDSPYFILQQYFTERATTGSSNVNISNSSLRGMNRTIVAKGGKFTQLFVKLENEDSHNSEYNEGFELDKISFKFEPLDVFLDGDYFRFNKDDLVTINVAPTGTQPGFDNGSEVYFRKDSYFHDWLKNNVTLYGDYINTNIEWLYFGKIYLVSSGHYRVVYDGMKNFALNALPQDNRTDTITDFFDIAFDQVYNQIYNAQKNLSSLLDPFEIHTDFLYYLAKMYDMEIPDILDEQSQREFVSNISNLLKRKGTYSSLFIIWQIFLRNTLNKLNVYERWHSPNIFTLGYTASGDAYNLNTDMTIPEPESITYTVYSCSGRSAEISGDELVSVGTFTSAASAASAAWKAGRGASIDTVDSSTIGSDDYCLLLKNGVDNQGKPDYGQVVQSVTVTAGDIYYFTASHWPGEQTNGWIRVGVPTVRSQYYSFACSAAGQWTEYSGYLKADGTTIDITLQNDNTEDGQGWFDNISLKRVTPLNCDYAFQGPSTTQYICSGTDAPLMSNEFIFNGKFDETGTTEGWSGTNISPLSGAIGVTDDYIEITQSVIVSASAYTKIYQVINLVSGDLYKFSCESNASSVSSSAGVFLGSTVDDDYYLSYTNVTSGWTPHQNYFFADNNETLYITLKNLSPSGGQNVRFRNISLREATPLTCPFAINNGISCSGSTYSEEPTATTCASLWTTAALYDQTGIGTCSGGIYTAELPPSASCGDGSAHPSGGAPSGSFANYTWSESVSAELGYISPSAWSVSAGYMPQSISTGTSASSGYSMLLTGLASDIPSAQKTFGNTASAYVAQLFTVPVNYVYELEGFVRKKSGDQYRVTLEDLDTPEVLYDTGVLSLSATSSASYTKFTHTFSPTGTMGDFKVSLYSVGGSGVYFDDVSVYKKEEVTVWPEPISHFVDVLYELTYGEVPDGCAGSYWYTRPFTLGDAMIHIQDDESASWTIPHGLYSRMIHIQTFEYNTITGLYDRIFPTEIRNTDYGTSIVGFESAVRGMALLQKSEFNKSVASSTSWFISHDQIKMISDFMNETYTYEKPDRVDITTSGVTEIDWSGSTAGYGIFTSASQHNLVYEYTGGVHQIKVEHNKNNTNVYTQFYDGNDELIVPDTLTLTNTSACIATFAYPLTGSEYALVREPIPASAATLADYNTSDSGMIVTPHYKVEMDLSCEPLNDNYIVNEEIMTWLVNGWEMMRPVARVAHYHQLISPIVDFTGSYRPLYDRRLYKGYLMSTFCSSAGTPDVWNDKMAHYQNVNKKRWWITHDRSSRDWIVQCYNKDWERIWPDGIEVRSNNDLILEFDNAINGYAFLVETNTSTSGASLETSAASATWSVVHSLDDDTPSAGSISQYENSITFDKIKAEPSNIRIIDKDTLLVTWGDTATVGRSQVTQKEYYHSQPTSAANWQVYHNLDERGIIIQAFDSNDDMITPDSVTLQNKNLCTLGFNTPINGYAILRTVPYNLIEQEIINIIDHWKIGTGEINPYQYEDIGTFAISGSSFTVEEDNTYYYIIIDVKKSFTADVTEIGLFDVNDEMLFYTKCSPLFNPSTVILTILYRIEKQT